MKAGLGRAGGFVWRFWPLWAPLLLLWILPLTRPSARAFWQPMREWLGIGQNLEFAPSARDLDGQLLLLLNPQFDPNYGSYYGYQTTDGFSENRRAQLLKQFPDRLVLIAPPVQKELGVLVWQSYYNAPNSPLSNAQQLEAAQRFAAAARRGQRLDPENALWWVAQCVVEWRAGRFDAAQRALERAGTCPRYDDLTLDLARRALGAQRRYLEPTLEEQRALLNRVRIFDFTRQTQAARVWSQYTLRLRNRGDHRGALKWGAAMARVGDLMQRDPNALPTMQAGAAWQRLAWRVGYARTLGSAFSPRAPTLFAAYAKAHSRPDIARATARQASRARALSALVGNRGPYEFYNNELWLRPGNLGKRLETLEIAFPVAFVYGAFLVFWWLMLNLFLWRGVGAPGARRDRVALSVAVALFCLALALLAVEWNWQPLGAAGPRSPLRDAIVSAVAAFAFVGTPFLLALGCALVTLRRHHATFRLKPRVDLELGLSPLMRGLLRWFLPVGVMASLGLFVVGWALWIAAVWRDWINVDVLALLPPDRNGKFGTFFLPSLWWPMATIPYPLIYGCAMCAVCLLCWFCKWRWGSARDARPVTHGALRWWKESVGGVLVIVAWLLVVAAVGVVPLRVQAQARLQKVLEQGDLWAFGSFD